MKTKLLTLLFAVCLMSCDSDSRSSQEKTAASLQTPVIIGELPDGRKICRVTIDQDGRYPHYVYYVNNLRGGTSTSNNTQVLEGKVTTQHVTVEIDGVTYAPVVEELNK